jgi:thiol-disulfide isomerase/thioredoxin/RNase P/RNase MRP subunit p29
MKMEKKIEFSLIIFISMLIFSCNNQNSIRIKGKIVTEDETTLYIDKIDLDKIITLDSARVENEKSFRFKIKNASGGFYQLRVENKIYPLLLHRGEQIVLEMNMNNYPEYAVENSWESGNLRELQKRRIQTQKKLDSVYTLYQDAQSEKAKKMLSNNYESIIQKYRNASLDYILKNTTSLTSLTALYDKLNGNYVFSRKRDLQYYKILSDSLGKHYPESRHVKALKNNAQRLISSINAERLMSSIEKKGDNRLPDLKLANTDRDTVRLSELMGNPVILGFWASWNKESIDYNLKLIDLYKKYKKRGLEAYMVSLDNKYDDWYRIVKMDEYPWINVSDLAFPESYAASVYNIQQLPTYYLINRNQDEVIGKNLSIDELDRRLAKILK